MPSTFLKSIFLYVLKCLIKVEVVKKKKRHFSKYLVKIHIKYSYFGKWPNHLFDSTHLCTGAREKEGQRAGCQCI